METATKLAFMHLPKCAGSSLHNYLHGQFPKSEICPHRFNNLFALSLEELDSYRLFVAHTDFAGLRRIPGEVYRITVLREPRDRILSLYSFWRGHDPHSALINNLSGPTAAQMLPLNEFLKFNGRGVPANIDNVYVRNFLGALWTGPEAQFSIDEDKALEIALENLRSFDTIGFVDDLPRVFSEVAAAMSFEPPEQTPHVNRSDRSTTAGAEEDPEIRRELDRLTRLDSIFYEEARKIVAERLAPPPAPRKRSLLERLRAS